MATSIEHDSELFTNLVSAKGIPSGRSFSVVTDSNGKPAVFSLSSDSRLYLYSFQDGAMRNMDFGLACGQNATVQAFTAVQTSDDFIFVCFAVATSSTTSQVLALPHLAPDRLASPVASDILKSATSMRQIRGMWSSNFPSKLGAYADIVVSYQAPGHISASDDCALLQVSGQAPTGSLGISTSWSLPVETDHVDDIAFGRNAVGDGIFVLYKVAGKQRLIFSTYDGSKYDVQPNCPQDATSLASVFTKTGDFPSSILWIGGRYPAYYLPKHYLNAGRNPVTVESQYITTALKDIHAVQNGDSYTVWFTDENDAAMYYTDYSVASPGQGRVVPLLPPGKGGRLSGMISTVSLKSGTAKVNTIISVDEEGHLTSFQQATQKGLWDQYPLMVYDKTNNYKVQSFTTRIRVRRGVNKVAGGSSFTLTSSGQVSAILGQIVQTDHNGEATFIIATSDLSSQTFTVSDVHDAKGQKLDAPSTFINPASKALQKLTTIRSGDDLRKNNIIMGNAADADKAGPVIGQLADHAKSLASQGSSTVSLNGALVAALSGPGSTVLEDLSEFWESIKSIAHKVEDFFITIIDGVKKFVIKLANSTMEFVLDTIDKVGKALSWVWEKLKTAIDELIKFLGFIFNWGDILDAKNSLSSLLNAGLDWGVDQIDWVKSKADGAILDLRKQLTDMPPVNEDKLSLTAESDSKSRGASSGIGFNWANYQLQHGGGFNSSVISGPDAETSIFDQIMPQINAAVTNIQGDIDNMIRQLSTTFKDTDTEISLSQLLTILAKTAGTVFLDLVKAIVDIFLTLVADIIKIVKKVGNQSIEIPIFSALYRMISGGHDLTIFDVICLVVAIPAQVMKKIITNEALPNITSYMNKDTLAAVINGSATADQTKAVEAISGYSFLGVSLLGSILGLVDYAVGSISLMSMSEKTVSMRSADVGLKHIVPASHMRMIEKSDRPSQDRTLTKINIACNYINVLTTIPIGSKDWKWASWSIGAFRAIGSTVLLHIEQSAGVKKIIAGVHIGLGLAQGITAIVYAAKNPPKEKSMMVVRLSNVSCMMLSRTCQSGAVILKGTEPYDLICEGGYLLFATINVFIVVVALEMGWKQAAKSKPDKPEFQTNPL